MNNHVSIAEALAAIARRDAEDSHQAGFEYVPADPANNTQFAAPVYAGWTTPPPAQRGGPEPYFIPGATNGTVPLPATNDAFEADRVQRTAILTHFSRNVESMRIALNAGMTYELFDPVGERPEKVIFAALAQSVQQTGALPPKEVLDADCAKRTSNAIEFDSSDQAQVHSLIAQIYGGVDAGWEIVRGLLAEFLFERRISRRLSAHISFGDLSDKVFEDFQPAIADIKALRSGTSGSLLLPPQSAGQLITGHQKLRAPIIHGLLRDGEVMNLIAPPKMGKSWLILNLALCIAAGMRWLGFDTVPGRVLILDNELHPETIANRLPRVAEKMGVGAEQYNEQIAYSILRGSLKDIKSLKPYLQAIKPGTFNVIVLDAFYRFLPPGTDENDNGAMCGLYNQIDAYAAMLKCAFILVHHTSKGIQAGRAVTDVGAGAGAISRAADCHLILRSHSEPDAVVLDANPRSWPPVPSTCLRFRFPLWETAPNLDPANTRKANSPPKPASPPAATSTPKWTTDRFVSAFIDKTPKTKGEILVQAEEIPGLSPSLIGQLLKNAEQVGKAYRWNVGTNKPPQFATVRQPDTSKTSGSEIQI